MKRIVCLIALIVLMACPLWAADVKISELPVVTETTPATDVVPVNASGVTSQITVENLLKGVSAIPLTSLAAQAAYTIVANGTSGSASPTAVTSSADIVAFLGAATDAAARTELGTWGVSGSITDEQLVCAETTGGTNLLKSCGAKTTDNSTGVSIMSKDNSNEVENLTLDAHLSVTGTTAPALAVVTPQVIYHAGTDTAPTAAQMTGNGVAVNNYDQGAADIFVPLPTAAAGLSGLYEVVTAQANHWGVQADTNDKIYLIAADGTIAAGDDHACVVMTAAQLGQTFACWTFKSGASSYDWKCKAIAIGTSTFAAHAAP